MGNDTGDRDDLEERMARLEETLEELQAAVAEDERVGRAKPAADAALRLAERVAVPAAVAALEANVRVLEFLQDRLRARDQRDRRGSVGPAEVSERALDRLDDALGRLEDAIEEADLPRDAEARRLLRRARDLNDEVRDRLAEPGPPSGPDVVEIDVEAELDEIREAVEDDASDADEA
ncbi:MAG: hypothetical protein ABEJ92_03955 [Halobacteriales archaeon]